MLLANRILSRSSTSTWTSLRSSSGTGVDSAVSGSTGRLNATMVSPYLRVLPRMVVLSIIRLIPRTARDFFRLTSVAQALFDIDRLLRREEVRVERALDPAQI